MIRNTNSKPSKLFYEINRIKLMDVVGGLLFVCLDWVLGLSGGFCLRVFFFGWLVFLGNASRISKMGGCSFWVLFQRNL